MSVIDFPGSQLGKLRMGTIVVVQLDPEASLAPLGDAVVDRAASQMTTARRLDGAQALMMDSRVARHWFYPIGRGLPQDAWASVAISPAINHRDGRPPLHTDGNLPLEDAYIHTTYGFEGLVSRIYRAAPSNIALSARDTRGLSEAQMYDQTRLRLGEGSAAAIAHRAELSHVVGHRHRLRLRGSVHARR